MKRELIKFNKGNHDNQLLYANVDLKAYNKLLKDIQPLAETIGVNIDKQVFASLLNNPKEYAFDTIIGNNPLTIGGAPVSKNKAMDLIDMPDAWVKIITLVDGFNQELIKTPVHILQHSSLQNIARIGLDSFELLNDEFVLSGDFVEALKTTHSQFTENDTHNAALEHVNTLNKTFTALSKLGCGVHAGSTLADFGYQQLAHGSSAFNFDASVIIGGIKHREWFAGLSDVEKANYNKYQSR